MSSKIEWPSFIYLVGYAGAGKDTLADELVKRQGYVKLAYADMLKDLWLKIGGVEPTPENRARLERRKRWDGGETRVALQRLGQGIRDLNPRFWVECLQKSIRDARGNGHERFVITDVRYPNEIDGRLIAIQRPVARPVNDHVSEANIAEIVKLADLTLHNTGTPEDLYNALKAALSL